MTVFAKVPWPYFMEKRGIPRSLEQVETPVPSAPPLPDICNNSYTMDLSYLERMCKGDHARMHRYIALYLQEAPDLFSQLEQALRSGRGETLATSAHSLRPQVKYMGGNILYSTLTTIEIRARARGAEACAELVSEAIAQNVALMASLRGWSEAVRSPNV